MARGAQADGETAVQRSASRWHLDKLDSQDAPRPVEQRDNPNFAIQESYVSFGGRIPQHIQPSYTARLIGLS
ncbi:hypothetical protein N7513_013192 [Penicillium frequentans]|nr:hypothetical protein N7513_013192 [Penicillium glabrum]